MRQFTLALLSSCVMLGAANAAHAVEAASQAPQGPKLADKGAVAATIESPYQLQLMYTGEEWGNTGGVKDGSIYMHNVFAGLQVDADKAFGLKGGSFNVQGFYNSEHSLDQKLMGAYEDSSVIDTGRQEMVRLYQAYYDQNFASTGTDLRLGFQDLQTEFGSSKPMDLFFGGSYAWTTTLDQANVHGQGGAASTYPATALALRVKQEITSNWSVQAAVADGIPDSFKHPKATTVNFSDNGGEFVIGEVDYRTAHHTKIMLGVWDFTGKFDDLSSTTAAGDATGTYGNAGAYIGGATRLYDQGHGRGLDAFANLGISQSGVNQADRTVNVGLNYTGPLAIRPEDKLGVAFSTAATSDDYKHSQTVQGLGVNDYESNFEVTYRAKINDYITVQPDAQYFMNPNMDPRLKDDFVAGIHVEIGHVFGL